MYRSQIRKKIRQQGLLHSVMLELTYRCNLDCFFCYNDKAATGKPLSLKQYVQLFDDLAEMQVLFVALTGGEPLLHPEFFAIGRAARERGFAIRIKSGGHGLRGKVAQRLKREVNPMRVELSLHGATAEVHERQTRVKGSFEQLELGIGEMKTLDLRPSLVSTLTCWNEHQTEEMYALADEWEVPLRFQGPVGPRDNGDTEPLKIQPSAEGWERFKKIIQQRRQNQSKPAILQNLDEDDQDETVTPHCGLGSQEVLVDPFGNVVPCLHVRRIAGNLHDSSIQTIWNSSKVFPQARQLAIDTTLRIQREGRLSILGAPSFCPGLELKGCKTTCGGCSG